MTKAESELHRVIRAKLSQRPDVCAEVTQQLWQSLAAQLVLIIGDAGFKSLLHRSLHLCGEQFPWLLPVNTSLQRDAVFLELSTRLAAQDVLQSMEASIRLLQLFIDILTVLIGDSLTTGIVRSAWGDDAFDLAATEFKK